MNSDGLMFFSIFGILIFSVISYLFYLGWKNAHKNESDVRTDSEFYLSMIAARNMPAFVGPLIPTTIEYVENPTGCWAIVRTVTDGAFVKGFDPSYSLDHIKELIGKYGFRLSEKSKK